MKTSYKSLMPNIKLGIFLLMLGPRNVWSQLHIIDLLWRGMQLEKETFYFSKMYKTGRRLVLNKTRSILGLKSKNCYRDEKK